MSFCLPLLRLQISDYESDAPGGRSSLQLLAKCSSAHYVPRGGRQRQGSKPTAPPFKKQVSLMWTHELKWLKLCREVLRMSNWWGCFFKKKINRTAFWGRVHRMEKLTKAHLLAFPEPRIHSARHRLSFCSIGLIRIRTWRAATQWEAPWYFFVNLNKNTWDFCQMTWHKHSRRNIMHNHQTVLCSI